MMWNVVELYGMVDGLRCVSLYMLAKLVSDIIDETLLGKMIH